MATALAHVAACEGRSSTLWCEDRELVDAIEERREHPRFFRGVALSSTLRATTDFTSAVRDADVIIVAVPSAAFRRTAERLVGCVDDRLVVSATKGLDPETHERLSVVLARAAGAKTLAVLGGANITPEIMAGQTTGILVATDEPQAVSVMARVLETRSLLVFGSGDIVGVELVSALKNVAAIAGGIATGLRLGVNATALIVTRAFAEVGELAVALGGTRDALLDVCGLGDLLLTLTHPASLNRRIGIELGEGKRLAEILAKLDEVPEGINSVRAHVELARKNGVRAPIANAVHAILEGSLGAADLERVAKGDAATRE